MTHQIKRSARLSTLLFLFAAGTTLAQDTRVPIDNTSYFPYNITTALRYDTDQDGFMDLRGSGVLVGPHMILTCGHCVYDRATEEYIDLDDTDIHLAPGMYQDDNLVPILPYGSRQAVRIRTNNKYADSNFTPRGDVDYGAAFFVCPFEELTTYMPLVFDYDPTFVAVNGYPVRDLPEPAQFQEQWMEWGPLVRLTDRSMTYQPPRSTGGASGSPVWVNDTDDGPFQVAVNRAHHTGVADGIGTRLVWQNEWLIGVWMDWEPSLQQIIAAGCHIQQLDWDQLLDHYQSLAEKLQSVEDLGLAPTPPPADGGQVTRRVHQFIENTLYRWEEVAIDGFEGAIGVRMLHPFERPLEVSEAQVLLSASRNWQDQGPSGEFTEIGHPGPEEQPLPVPAEDEQETGETDRTLDEAFKG